MKQQDSSFGALSVDEVEVLAKNRAFYASFRERDLLSMDELWARQAEVVCVHPGWEPLFGRAQVMASWKALLEQSALQAVTCEGARVFVTGDSALVVCEEVLSNGRLSATNLFIREGGEWLLLHHQAGPIASSAIHGEVEGLEEDLLMDLSDRRLSDEKPSLLGDPQDEDEATEGLGRSTSEAAAEQDRDSADERVDESGSLRLPRRLLN